MNFWRVQRWASVLPLLKLIMIGFGVLDIVIVVVRGS